MIVVSDSSPLISLASVGRLDLLRQLFTTVMMPEAVWRETVEQGEGRAGAAEIASLDWIQTAAPANYALLSTLQQSLGAGEAQAIALAVELRADLLLMDERRGRSAAAAHGLTVTGLVGVLLESKRAGLLPAVKPVLDELTARGSMWLSQPLYHHALRLAGE